MALKCELFAGDPKLEAAAVSNPAHILRGAVGPHVGKIQKALISVDNSEINKTELQSKTFGASTEAAVLAYKTKRKIINTTYQRTPDAIVGIMTMDSLDKEMLKFEESLNEITVLSALATAFGYHPEQQLVVTDQFPLKSTIQTLQSNIKK